MPFMSLPLQISQRVVVTAKVIVTKHVLIEYRSRKFLNETKIEQMIIPIYIQNRKLTIDHECFSWVKRTRFLLLYSI